MESYLITGNLGYIGPVLETTIKSFFPDSNIVGVDLGFFRDCTLSPYVTSGRPAVDTQYYADVRDHDAIKRILKTHNINHVIYLSAISNDPMGVEFAEVTNQINNLSAVELAKSCVDQGIESFVFASSCSVYGKGSDKPRIETDPLNPLTEYAKSKVNAENALLQLSQSSSSPTTITCLRFATACGFSPRLRLDLVLNDFVATALSTSSINILSNGQPWRPLIDVSDMSRLMTWATLRSTGRQFEIYNAGSIDCNYQVHDLAKQVSEVFGNNISVSINSSAPADDRSYRVDFGKLHSDLDPAFMPSTTLNESILALAHNCKSASKLLDPSSRQSLVRLHVLRRLKHEGLISSNLSWQ